MGSIALVEKDEDVYYNGIKIYNGSGHVGAGGWGVRERSAALGVGTSVLSYLNLYPTSQNITYVSFRVKVAAAVGDEVKFSIWKKKNTTGTFFTLLNTVTIDQTMVDAQYGAGVWGVENDKIYTIELDEAINILADKDYSYYVVVYATGCTLDYDTTGATNGAYWVVADMTIAPGSTYLVSGMTLANWAVSFECFTEPDAWSALTYGGAISEENTDWHNASWCSTPAGEWDALGTSPVNIYGAGVATSTANGDALYVDVGASAALPTGDAWDPSLEVSNKIFPDYTAYGVRALTYIYFDVDMGASGTEKIYIQVNDTDDDTQYPTTGWQTMYTITGTNAVTGTVYIPVIARWVRFVKGGTDTNQCDIDDIEIHNIAYAVADGDFPINMVNSEHHCWVKNYPTALAIMKAAVKNMAGAEGNAGLPFTNRENVD